MKKHEQALLFLRKAEEDEKLLDEVIHSEKVSDEIFGFHCQQAAEKLLKAILSDRGIHFRKTDDLRELSDLLEDNKIPLPDDILNIDLLTPYGTLFRYDVLDLESAFEREAARKMIQRLREWVVSRIESTGG